MRDVEEVGREQRRAIECVVAREREPRTEVRRREPRVAQHRAVARLDEQAGVADERDPHRAILAVASARARISGVGVAFNHLGQCVTDLERSKRFYVELLDFTVEREIHPPDELSGRLLRLPPPLGMTALYLRR